MNLLNWITGGRPMTFVATCFVDVVSGRQVCLWRDRYNRLWMATNAWSWFRVRPNHGPEIWQ